MSDQEETDELAMRWPSENDRLVAESAPAGDAFIVGCQHERFYRLAIGYKQAGDILVEQAIAQVVNRSNVIYPALFCYRQAIELSLKKLVDEFSGEKAKNTHDLNLLWGQFMTIVNERGLGSSLGIVSAQKLVGEMHNADQKPDAFRFPMGTNGAQFPIADRGIDLDNLREVMAGLMNLL